MQKKNVLIHNLTEMTSLKTIRTYYLQYMRSNIHSLIQFIGHFPYAIKIASWRLFPK